MTLIRQISKENLQTYRDKDFYTLEGTKSLSVENVYDHDKYTTGSASVNYLTGENKWELSAASGEVAIHQTNYNAPYFEGKVQKIELTQEDFQPVVGVQKGYGYLDFMDNDPINFFSNQDGIALISQDTTVRLVTYREGTEVNSIDVTSLMTNGWDKFGVVDIYFLWLGGAVVNAFIFTPDSKKPIVELEAYSQVGQTDVIFRNPQKPITAFVRGISASGSMKQICGMIGTENNAEEIKNIIPFETELVETDNVNQFYHMASIRYVKSLGRGLHAALDGLGFFSNTANDAGRLYITEGTSLALSDGYNMISADGVVEVNYTEQSTGNKNNLGRIIDIFPISLNGDSNMANIGRSKSHVLRQSLDLSGANENKTFSIFYSPDSNGQDLGIVGKLKQYN